MVDLYYACVNKLELQYLELPSLHSSWLTWVTRSILHKMWKVEMKEQTYSSRSWCRERDTAESHTHHRFLQMDP